MKTRSPKKLAAAEVGGRGVANSLAYQLKQQRSARRLSQREVAQKAGTTQAAIALLESGRANPTLKQIEKVAAAMKLELQVGLRRRLGD